MENMNKKSTIKKQEEKEEKKKKNTSLFISFRDSQPKSRLTENTALK